MIVQLLADYGNRDRGSLDHVRLFPQETAISRGLPASRFMQWEGSAEGNWADFGAGASHLEFVNEPLGFDTGRAGLRCDEFRRKIPSKQLYRPWVKAAFEALPANGLGGGYTPEKAAQVQYSMLS